jgi:hypothetical protein
MTIKAVESTATGGETSTTLEIDAPDSVKEEIGEYLVEQILAATAESTSPVAGYGKFPALSKLYKAKKEEEGRSGVPNLDFDGDMLSALDYEITDEGLKIGVFGDQAPKADGHNNLSGESMLPLRRFLPDAGESFKKDINSEIEAILAEKAVAEVFDDLDTEEIEEALEAVETRDDFFAALIDLTGVEEEYLLKGAVMANPSLLKVVTSMGLKKYLK